MLHSRRKVVQSTEQVAISMRQTQDHPLYMRIAEDLRARIAALSPGDRIPSEPQLARDWGVSRFTVARAVGQLADEGHIVRRQGKGSFVAEAPLRRVPGYLLSFTEAARAAGHKSSHRLLSFGPAEWRPGLPYDRGSRLVLADRLRFVDGQAVARHRSILSAELMDRIGLTEKVMRAPDFSLYGFFDRSELQASHADERLVARLASKDERHVLKLPANAVVVAVTRHSFAADGTALDAVDAVYDARGYSYEARLVRQHEPNVNSSGENGNEDLNSDRGNQLGPRLGPWGD